MSIQWENAMTTTPQSKNKALTATTQLPVEPGMLIFIAGDLLLFSVFFFNFLYNRSADPELYRRGASELSEALGLANTLLLLSSSWLVALAMHALRIGEQRRAIGATLGGAFVGVMFITIKFIEYGSKISTGFTASTNDFFMFYFMFTGIHLIHVIAGIGLLIYSAMMMRSPEIIKGPINFHAVAASFWHLVDLLWVILFPLIYLLR